MAISSTSSSTSFNKISGLVSGMDTESMVKSLVASQQSKIDKAKQARQVLEWQQSGYRDIISQIKTFQDKYFNVLNKENYMMSTATYNSYTAAATLSGVTSTAVSVSATGNPTASTHAISDIVMAQKDVWKGSNIADMVGSGSNVTNIAAGSKINVTLDGVTKTITLSGGTAVGGGYADINELQTDLQSKLNTVLGNGKVTVGTSSGELSFTSAGHVFQLTNNNTGDTVLTNMGFTSGDRNTLNKTKSLGDTNFVGDIFEGGNTISFMINGKPFSFDKSSDTVDSILTKVNNDPDTKVKMYYSELTNSFSLESTSEGAANAVTFSDTVGKFFTNGLNMGGVGTHVQTASDATFMLDGVSTSRTTNNFTIDGITYTLKESTHDNPMQTINISVTSDTSKTKTAIMNFVKDYNELIKNLNTKVNEKRDRTYQPLTDSQKEEMSEKQIEQWEEKAKTGLLRSDSIIQNVISDFRSALFPTTASDSLSLFDMGITTSSIYSDGGKLVIDETKLDSVLKSNPDEVNNLFTNATTGISVKFKEILDENIKTTGTKGVLLQKAGVEGSTTEYDNIITTKIIDYDIKINTLLSTLKTMENRYYNKFSAMESALQKMNTQSSWLTSQLGGTSSSS